MNEEKINAPTVKELRDYLANYRDEDVIRVVGAIRETALQSELVDIQFFGVLKPGEYEYPIFLMEIRKQEEAAE